MAGPIRVKNGRLPMTCFALILVSLDNGVVVYADRILLSWSIVGSRREANFEERSDRTKCLLNAASLRNDKAHGSLVSF